MRYVNLSVYVPLTIDPSLFPKKDKKTFEAVLKRKSVLVLMNLEAVLETSQDFKNL